MVSCNNSGIKAAAATAAAVPSNDHGQCPPPTTTTIKKTDEQRHLLWLKIRCLYLFYFCSIGSLVPYLPVFYRSLGHSGSVIGMLSALRPFVNFCVAPLWGILADYVGDPLYVVQVAAVGSVLGYVSIGLQQENAYGMVIAVILTSIFYAPIKSLMDSMVLERLSDTDKQEFGKLRLWGPIGFGVGCSIAGMVVTHVNQQKLPLMSTEDSAGDSNLLQGFLQKSLPNLQASGYTMLFFNFVILSIPMLLILATFPPAITSGASCNKIEKQIQQHQKCDNQKGGLLLTQQNNVITTLLQDRNVMIFFMLVLAVGINNGVVETFCYVRMREVGATAQHIGFSRLISAMAGTPMFWFAGNIKRFITGGRNKAANNNSNTANADQQIIILSLLGYALRFVLYALIRNPVDALPAEAMRGIVFALFYSTATTSAHRLAPPGFQSTMLMVMNSLYGGVGQSIGSMLAGKIQSDVGTSGSTFQMFLIVLCGNLAFVGSMVLYRATAATYSVWSVSGSPSVKGSTTKYA